MDNLDGIIDISGLNHSQLSKSISRPENWFNAVFNNNEDITISSFIRILSVINENFDLNEYDIFHFFDEKILKIATSMHALHDEDDTYLKQFIKNDLNIFTDLVSDWGIMLARNKLADIEKETLTEIDNFINSISEGDA